MFLINFHFMPRHNNTAKFQFITTSYYPELYHIIRVFHISVELLINHPPSRLTKKHYRNDGLFIYHLVF